MTDRIYRTVLRELSRVATTESLSVRPLGAGGVALDVNRKPGMFRWEFFDPDEDDAIAASIAREYPEPLRTQPTQPHTYRSILRVASQMILAGDRVRFTAVAWGYLVEAMSSYYGGRHTRSCRLPTNADDAAVHLELSLLFAAIHR